MKPIIGVSCAWSVETWGDSLEHGGYIYVGSPYVWAVANSGGFPILVGPAKETNLEEAAKQVIEMVDGLLLTGGGDARRFKPEELPPLKEQQPLRYEFETYLIQEAFKKDIPVMGICRGHQMIAEVLGGRIGKNTINGHKQKEPGTKASHGIIIEQESALYNMCGTARWEVNSFHIQAVEAPPEGFRISSRSEDGVIESIEAVNKKFFIGMQFHPEELFPVDDIAKRIFKNFIDIAKRR